MNLSLGNIRYYILKAVSIIIVVTLHGFLTALCSKIMGDDIPERDGTLTLNPKKHFEPVGFLLMLFFNFGWGQPIRTSGRNYKNYKLGSIFTALVPVVFDVIFSMILFALNPLLTAILNKLSFSNDMALMFFTSFSSFIFTLGITALAYGLFNLIPVYPLNGHKLLSALLSPNACVKYNQMEKVLQLILCFLIFFGVIEKIYSLILGGIVFAVFGPFYYG